MPSPVSKAQAAGIGAVISIGSVTGVTDVYTAIGEITDAKFSGAKRAIVTTTSFDSAGVASKLGTILDSGSVTITTTRVSSDAGQVAVLAAFNAQPANAYDFKVVLPLAPGQTTIGDSITFSAIVSAAGDFDIDISKQAEYTFTLEITGAKTLAVGS